MAKQPAFESTTDADSTTNIAKAIQQHGFSGETCEIKLTRADPNEPDNLEKMTWVERARFPMQSRNFMQA